MQRLGITVTGFPGSGSTTFGKKLAKKLNWPPPYYSGGVIRWLTAKIEEVGREMVLAMPPQEVTRAMESGLINPQPRLTQAYAEFPPELDRLVDWVQMEFLEKKDCGVHEGRIAWFLAKKLHEEGRALDKIFINICCVVDPQVGALRQLERAENSGKTTESILEDTEKRVLVEQGRYDGLYGLKNHLAPDNFDVVIDTTELDALGVLWRALQLIDRIRPKLLSPHLGFDVPGSRRP
ncbi:MAG: hypothetical protein HYW89_02270 [Candidatus Sungiibacteriota bacterium]|uniref:Cytidylate kinase-like family protein n=1 Tax=Candidatus Sungiibacteriota bacterium TaxID=2750080 RepID=A0A7T5RL62_9BACT|nr:MAG: hypothetical protein HYW89_02270 [Candidatus Sungbacteria bacterium]